MGEGSRQNRAKEQNSTARQQEEATGRKSIRHGQSEQAVGCRHLHRVLARRRPKYSHKPTVAAELTLCTLPLDRKQYRRRAHPVFLALVERAHSTLLLRSLLLTLRAARRRCRLMLGEPGFSVLPSMQRHMLQNKTNPTL